MAVTADESQEKKERKQEIERKENVFFCCPLSDNKSAVHIVHSCPAKVENSRQSLTVHLFFV